MNEKQIAEFNELSKEIPVAGYEGYRAIHPVIYKTLIEQEKNISYLEGLKEGLSKGQEIVNKVLNEL